MARTQLKPRSARSASPSSSYLYRALALAAFVAAALLFVGAPTSVAAQPKENVSIKDPILCVIPADLFLDPS